MSNNFPPQARAYEKLINQMVPIRYKFIENLQVIGYKDNYNDYYEEEIHIINVVVNIKVDALKECSDELENDEGEWENISENSYFRNCVNSNLKDGFLSYLVILGRYIFTQKKFLIISLGANWYSDGDLYDDEGNTINDN